MSALLLFVQVHDQPGIVELEIAEVVTERGLHDRLSAAGIAVTAETFVFMDENETPVNRHSDTPVRDLRHGSRVHVTRCHRVAVTVHFMEQTIERHFAPGAHVRAVKVWAAHEFHLDHRDAAEHVLQICKSTSRPSGDTPLQALVSGHSCALCFDLVPEKRVEG